MIPAFAGSSNAGSCCSSSIVAESEITAAAENTRAIVQSTAGGRRSPTSSPAGTRSSWLHRTRDAGVSSPRSVVSAEGWTWARLRPALRQSRTGPAADETRAAHGGTLGPMSTIEIHELSKHYDDVTAVDSLSFRA